MLLRMLTFLVHQKLIEMAQSFQTEALDGSVRVLAQDAQRGYQLPDPYEVLLGLCREHGIDVGLPPASRWLPTHPRMASTIGSLALRGRGWDYAKHKDLSPKLSNQKKRMGQCNIKQKQNLGPNAENFQMNEWNGLRAQVS